MYVKRMYVQISRSVTKILCSSTQDLLLTKFDDILDICNLETQTFVLSSNYLYLYGYQWESACVCVSSDNVLFSFPFGEYEYSSNVTKNLRQLWRVSQNPYWIKEVLCMWGNPFLDAHLNSEFYRTDPFRLCYCSGFNEEFVSWDKMEHRSNLNLSTTKKCIISYTMFYASRE